MELTGWLKRLRSQLPPVLSKKTYGIPTKIVKTLPIWLCEKYILVCLAIKSILLIHAGIWAFQHWIAKLRLLPVHV